MLPLIEIPRIDDDRGSLCVFQGFAFPVRRVYFIFGVDHMAARGAHAHRTLHRYLIAIAGSFLVTLDAGQTSLYLCRPDRALYVAPMRWLDLAEFSKDAVCLVLASAEYDAEDYIRDRAEWERMRNA